jgi:hypothetical protein
MASVRFNIHVIARAHPERSVAQSKDSLKQSPI